MSEDCTIKKNDFAVSRPIIKYVLSPKAFEAMAAIPTSLSSEESRSLGDRLTGAAKEAGSQAGRAIITDLIGQIIGAAGRSFFGG